MAAAKTTSSSENREGSNARRSGFTLVELLVVIAIIAILASILLPVLSKAKARGYTVVCLNNERQLALGWNLYPDDHEDYLPYNLGVGGTLDTIARGEFKNWANNVMSWDLLQSNTNTAQLAAGGLGPYLSGVVQPFRCPSDRLLSNPQRGAGWRERTRSYSMNAMLGYPGEFFEGGRNTNNPSYKQFMKLAEVLNPAGIFVFIEEHPDTISDGYFLNKFGVLQWFDLPAAYHNDGANISFADMHVEYRKWISPSTLQPEVPELVPYPISIPANERADYDWLMERVSYPTYYHAGAYGK